MNPCVKLNFARVLRRFLRLARKSIYMRDSLSRFIAGFAREYLSAAIPWLTFSCAKSALLSQNGGLRRAVRHGARLISPKSEQRPLFGPFGRQMCHQAHQFLGVELWR